MKLQQVIVEAKNSASPCQNKVVGKSKGVDSALLDDVLKCSTTRSEILDGHGVAIFYCKSRGGTGLIGRSFVAEFDSEGNRPLRTHILLVTSKQLKCYYNNPVLVARAFDSSGVWILKTAGAEAELPELEMADHAINAFTYSSQTEQVDRALDAIKTNERIAVTDLTNPLDFVGHVLQAHHFVDRAAMSFAINRRVTANSPFRINAYARGDIQLQHDLLKYRVFPVRPRSEAVRSS